MPGDSWDNVCLQNFVTNRKKTLNFISADILQTMMDAVLSVYVIYKGVFGLSFYLLPYTVYLEMQNWMLTLYYI